MLLLFRATLNLMLTAVAPQTYADLGLLAMSRDRRRLGGLVGIAVFYVWSAGHGPVVVGPALLVVLVPTIVRTVRAPRREM